MSVRGWGKEGISVKCVSVLYIKDPVFSRDTRYGYRNFSYSLSRVRNNFTRYVMKFVSQVFHMYACKTDR